jgi:hypothetical protein
MASCVILADCMAGFSLKGIFWSEGTCSAEALCSLETPALRVLHERDFPNMGLVIRGQNKHPLTGGERHAYLTEGLQRFVKRGSTVAIPASKALLHPCMTSLSTAPSYNWCTVLNVQI